MLFYVVIVVVVSLFGYLDINFVCIYIYIYKLNFFIGFKLIIIEMQVIYSHIQGAHSGFTRNSC